MDPDVIEECLEVALQAPTASNSQQWQWLVLTDPEKIAGVAEIYRDSFMQLAAARAEEGPRWPEGDSRRDAEEGVTRSATYLAENMHRCPALLIACINGRVEDAGPMAQAGTYGSIIPGAWSFMLAARSRGIGMAWTTLHLRDETASASCSAYRPRSRKRCCCPWPTSPAQSSSPPRACRSNRSSTGTSGAGGRPRGPGGG